MPKDTDRWTLQDVVDLEAEIAAAADTPPDVRRTVREAACGLDGSQARRAGLRVWLEAMRSGKSGATFVSALSMVASLLTLAMFLTGIGAVLGMVDREKTGVHVTLFLAILIGGQWLVLIFAAIAWLVRRRAAEGFSLVQALIGRLARRFAGGSADSWWHPVSASGGAAREAMWWRVARIAQAAGVSFNLGILCGLGGLVLVRHVGFFWETTTELAMHSLLESTCGFLSAPWSAWWPAAVPDAAVIEASRWLPERELPPGPAAWWRFLLMASFVWGLLPRLALWITASLAERRALARLDFQSRAHRALWRDLTGTGRIDADDKPLDGVLVLDVGGSGINPERLRPFLLRHLRVHPAGWHSVAVLDAGGEQEAARALAKAPAGVVLLAEGWSLSPARMSALHAKIRSTAGPAVPVKFLVANSGPENHPLPPTREERHEWERFTDSLRDPEAEVFFFAE